MEPIHSDTAERQLKYKSGTRFHPLGTTVWENIQSRWNQYKQTPPRHDETVANTDLIDTQYTTQRKSIHTSVYHIIQSRRHQCNKTPPNNNCDTNLARDDALAYSDVIQTQCTTKFESPQATVWDNIQS